MVDSVGGFAPEVTLSERYELTINNEIVLKDFIEGDDSKKMEVARYLTTLGIYEEELLMAFEEEALRQYKSPFKNKTASQPPAYICRYIASSKMKEFQPTITEISEHAESDSIRKYVQKYLYGYYGE